eukprot:IDg3027t1
MTFADNPAQLQNKEIAPPELHTRPGRRQDRLRTHIAWRREKELDLVIVNISKRCRTAFNNHIYTLSTRPLFGHLSQAQQRPYIPLSIVRSSRFLMHS